MISGWLIKVVLGIAIAGFLAVELGSPLINKAQAQDAADEIATEVGFRLRDTFTNEAMRETCQTEAEEHSVTIDLDAGDCTFDTSSEEVVVTVHKEARSFLFKKFGPMEDWYDINATARTKIPSA